MFTAKIGGLGALVSRVKAVFQPRESLVMQAKRMLTTISPEALVLMATPSPSLAYAGHPTTMPPRDLDRPIILHRTDGQRQGPLVDRRQKLLCDVSINLRGAGRQLGEEKRSAEQNKRPLEEDRRSFREWKKIWATQIAAIKFSTLPKSDKVSAIQELIEDLRHYPFLTDMEKAELSSSESKALAAFSAQK